MLYLIAATDIAMAAVFVAVLWGGFKDYREDCRRG